MLHPERSFYITLPIPYCIKQPLLQGLGHSECLREETMSGNRDGMGTSAFKPTDVNERASGPPPLLEPTDTSICLSAQRFYAGDIPIELSSSRADIQSQQELEFS